jgi:hypothetical protein
VADRTTRLSRVSSRTSLTAIGNFGLLFQQLQTALPALLRQERYSLLV